MNIDQYPENFHNAFPGISATGQRALFLGRVGNIMNLTPQPNPFFPNILYWKTSNGSVYIPLPNGQTLRYKYTEEKWQEPQDLCVFVPSEDWIRKNAPQDVLSKITNDNNQSIFYELLREYLMPLNTNKKVYIQDQEGNPIFTNAEAQKAEHLFITLVLNGQPIVSIPVKKQPEVGYSPYDSRRIPIGDGMHFHERHIGHPIKSIILREK